MVYPPPGVVLLMSPAPALVKAWTQTHVVHLFHLDAPGQCIIMDVNTQGAKPFANFVCLYELR